MVEAAARQGWVSRDGVILEILTCLRRAGADLVITYWATEVARRIGSPSQ
jgi:porphobilinogen synthase